MGCVRPEAGGDAGVLQMWPRDGRGQQRTWPFDYCPRESSRESGDCGGKCYRVLSLFWTTCQVLFKGYLTTTLQERGY